MINKQPRRFDELGTVNAVRLLPKIDSFNNYIKLYTEIDSHIEVGDIVYITFSGNTENLDIDKDVILDNFLYITYDDNFIYNQYAQGYKVLWVDKANNSFVINRLIHTIPVNKRLFGHFVSKVVVYNNITINKGKINGVVFKNCSFNPSGITNNVILQQAVVLGGNITNCNITNKYADNYVTLSLEYNVTNNTYTKYYNLNNNGFGYSYFYNLNSSILNSDISSGYYYNCHIKNTSTSKKYIRGGYFYNCYVDKYHIYDGYFHNTDQLTSDCIWHYGKWDGNTFTLPKWENGIFINGEFGIPNQITVWQNGIFLNGIWKGLIWFNGDFNGGMFIGTGYTNNTGQNIATQWFNGNFRGGIMKNQTFNSIIWRDGNVYDGELHNVVFNSGNIYGGTFYNVKMKNVNIYNGDFKTKKVISTSNAILSFNTFANCKIYGGKFYGEWCSPVYSSSNTLTYSNGYNEFTSTVIHGGTFKYPFFYNSNVIKNGDFEDGFFFAPIEIYDGKFYGGRKNKITGNNTIFFISSNVFRSEKYTLNKCFIRSKIVQDLSGVTHTKMCLEFDDEHNFTVDDAGKSVTLFGFNSQELNNLTSTIILKNKYLDISKPTTQSNSGYNYQFVEPVGKNYIIIEEPYKTWMFGDTGIVKKMEWLSSLELLTSASTKYYNIYNGKFNKSEFYGNINIYNGIFNNTKMANGIRWYNGIFDGGVFRSEKNQPDNLWYNGQFRNGVFGYNVLGQKETCRISIFNSKCEIDDSILGPQSGTTYILSGIYPLVYVKHKQQLKSNNAYFDAFLTSDNTLTNEWVRVVTDDRAGKYMNAPVWDRNSPYLPSDISDSLYDYFISPYEFVFRIYCNSYESRMRLKRMLDLVSTNPNYNVSIISPSDIENIIENIVINDQTTSYQTTRYLTFNEMYDMDYEFVDYIIGNQINNIYPIYIIFRFNTIKNLFDNCTESEKELFAKNFRNVWSIANTGYYTHPMPVLSARGNIGYGFEDLNRVGKMVIKLSNGTYITNSKWIYGTCPPPWWLNTNGVPYIDWNVMFNEIGVAQTNNVESIGTYTNNTGSVISNNNTQCDGYVIPTSKIAERILNSINVSIRDVDSLSNTTFQQPYPKKFTEWLYHYIYQHKNRSGYNFSLGGVDFRGIYRNQVLKDPKFNIVKDFRSQINCKLHNLIYNSQQFDCKIIGNAVYFDNNVNLTEHFSVGDKIYLQNTTLPPGGGGGMSAFNIGGISGGLTLSTMIVDGEYEIIAISSYTYNSYENNVVWIANVSPLTNCTAKAYITNRGLVVPYYYYVGKNGAYNFISQCNFETISIMRPTTPNIMILPEYNPERTFKSITYKDYGTKLGIVMQPIFHSYYPNVHGFYITQGNTNKAYYNHRIVYGCEMTYVNNKYRLIFKDLLPWGISPGDVIYDENFNSYSYGDVIITSPNTKQQFLNPNNIKRAWKYKEGSTNWISLSYSKNDITHNIIKGTWRVGNSGVTSTGNFYVEITDQRFYNLPSFTLPPSNTYVHVGLEPTPSCSGKIVVILYKDAQGNIKTINTTILDYDFVNKAYIFDTPPAGVYMNAEDVWLGTNMKSYNIFNLPPNISGTSAYPLGQPSQNPSINYNLPHWYPQAPYSMDKATITFPAAFEKLSVNPDRDYLVSTIIKYSGITATSNISPIESEKVVNSQGIPKTTPTSIIYDNLLGKFIYRDIVSSNINNNITIYQNSIPAGYSGTWYSNGRMFEYQRNISTDYWNNVYLMEKISFIKTKTNTSAILPTDGLRIEIRANYNIDSRIVIQEVNLFEKISDAEVKNLYPTFYIDSNSGMSRFGVPQVHGNESQNRIFHFMKNVVGNNSPADPVWYYGGKDYSEYHNFHDAALFSVYHSYMKNRLANYSSFEINDVFMRFLFLDMKNSQSTFTNIYDDILTDVDKENFKKWNSRIQTSTQNFNKIAGIQIYSKNVTANPSDFKDHWYNGEFHGYKFEGKWHGGKWVSGYWFGWNSLNTDALTSADTAFMKPSDFDISSKYDTGFEINYDLLKQRKRYYEIPPWDESKDHNNNIIKHPVKSRKK